VCKDRHVRERVVEKRQKHGVIVNAVEAEAPEIQEVRDEI
jgi:hypothetical protein